MPGLFVVYKPICSPLFSARLATPGLNPMKTPQPSSRTSTSPSSRASSPHFLTKRPQRSCARRSAPAYLLSRGSSWQVSCFLTTPISTLETICVSFVSSSKACRLRSAQIVALVVKRSKIQRTRSDPYQKKTTKADIRAATSENLKDI